MHKLLARQIAKVRAGEQLDIDLLIALVSKAYERFDARCSRRAGTSRPPITEAGGRRVSHENTIERLVEENRILDAALEHMAQGVAVFDVEKRLVVCNRRYAEIYNFPPSLLLPGTPFTELVAYFVAQNQYASDPPAEYRPHKLQDALSVGDSIQRFADGRFIAVARRPMQDGGWVTTHEDVTEREELHAKLSAQHEIAKEQETQLRLQNMHFDVAINNMIEGFCFFDKEQRLIICNKRFVEMYNLPPESVYPGITLREVIKLRYEAGNYPAMSVEEYYAARNHVAVGNVPSDTEVELTNGKILEIHHRPMPDGGWVATHEDITQRRRVEARIAHLAHHDALTDLPNRVLLAGRLGKALDRLSNGEMIAVLLFDLDHFKNVNDSLGHPIGDQLLQVVSERLKDVVRETDTVARTGGDEFAIVQSGVKQASDAARQAERVIAAVSAPYDIAGHQILIGTSVGIAIAPVDGETGDELIRNADLALYRSKAQGRGTFSFFESGMDRALQDRRLLEADLRKALTSGEFELHYQPIVHMPSGRITSCEALLRWRHHQNGVIMPDRFIPLAEEIGLIIPIGEWVVREACKFAAQWPDDIKISINLSPNQLRDADLCQRVITALAISGLAPERLQLEITETVLLANTPATMATFNRLRAMGIRIAIDDFGAGYSSLSYLHNFRFDNIKIDRSFVKDVTHNIASRSIVRAIAVITKGLGMICTAEGVETEEQQAILFSEGCSEMQGYLFSLPLAPDQLMQVLRDGAVRSPVAGFEVTGAVRRA
jgi:diguanylate cyclase (GGDEF)-like protein